MLKRIALTIFALLLAIPSFAQVSSNTARRIITGSALPATCNVGDVWFKTAATVGQYNCNVANTWTLVTTAAGGGITGTLVSGRVPIANGTQSVTSDADLTFATDTLTATKGIFPTALKAGTTGANEASSILQVKETGASAATGGPVNLLVSSAGSNIQFGVLNTAFGTDIYDGMTLYQATTGIAHIDVGGDTGPGTYLTFNPTNGNQDYYGWISVGFDPSASQTMATFRANHTRLGITTDIQAGASALSSSLEITDGTSTFGEAFSQHAIALVSGDAALGAMGNVVGHRVNVAASDTSSGLTLFGRYDTITASAMTGFTNIIYHWMDDLGSQTGTNKYYNWMDSRGVGRCREDTTFNSVGQVICTTYNPQFTKYTPGSANYERIIYGQFNSNVGEIGLEAGGSGTLRNLRLLGATVLFPTNIVAEASIGILTDTTSGHTITLQGYDNDGAARATFATITNGNTPSMTISQPSGGTLTFSGLVQPRVASTTSSATPTPDSATTDMYILTAQGAAAAFAVPSGAPVQGQGLTVRITDDGTARALTWSSSSGGYRASTDLALPSTTILGKTMYLRFLYNTTASKWDLVAYLDNF